MKTKIYRLFFLSLIVLFYNCGYRHESEFIKLEQKIDSLEFELKRTNIKLKKSTDSLRDVIKDKDSVIQLKGIPPNHKFYKKLNPIKREQKLA
jgi:hypothetical protein